MDDLKMAPAPHYIPYVNGADFLIAALESVRAYQHRIVVIDNRDVFTGEPEPSTFVPYPVTIHKPEMPLPHSLLQTWMVLKAREAGHAWFTWMHHDCIVQDETFERLIALAEASTVNGRRWGVIFTKDPTHYAADPWNHVDVLSAINVAALVEVGGWNYNRYPNYWSDYNCYGRLQAAGFEMIQSGLDIIHQGGGSQTAVRDDNRAQIKAAMWDGWQHLWAVDQQALGISWPPR